MTAFLKDNSFIFKKFKELGDALQKSAYLNFVAIVHLETKSSLLGTIK